ncbi:MAG: aspartate 1-decarboxylase [Acidobacteriota bacterium]
MRRDFLWSKIHAATVTAARRDYMGSLTLGRDLLEAAQLAPFQRIEVYNITSGRRFATYVIAGEPGVVCVNGAAAHLARVGDSIIIAAYCQLEVHEVEKFTPRLVFVDADNRQIALEESKETVT